ncbi:MAG TPA: hypothetical protein VKY27_00260 [Bacteriovoracaceae bacterium]|nr:hypothetical protein [Bacteriovoracaceae bacterium]
MNLMDFYLNSNAVREFVLSLCKLSNQVFEISLNSSLVTDELSSLGHDFKSYAVYSEKMNLISNTLGNTAKNMLRFSTRIMELSLEKTTLNANIAKLEEGRNFIRDEKNYEIVTNSISRIEEKIAPLEMDAKEIMGILREELKGFSLEIKKLWLLATNLKTQVEYDEITYLTNISVKIESALTKIDETMGKLQSQLIKLENKV